MTAALMHRSKEMKTMTEAALDSSDASERQRIDDAVQHIQGVLARTLSRGMMEVGSYLLDTFFDESARDTGGPIHPHKNASLRLLAQQCESLSLPVSRTFLSNAIRIAAVSRSLPRSAAFLKLPPSHRVELLRLRNPERIERLAVTCLEEAFTVQRLRVLVQQRVARLRLSSGGGRPRKAPVVRALNECVQLLRNGTTGRLAFRRQELTELSLEDLVRARSARKELEKRLEELGALLDG